RVVARLVSSDSREEGTSSFLPVGSYFVNLRIAGAPVAPRPHDVLMRCGKLADLEHQFHDQESPFVDPDGKRFRFPSASRPGRSRPRPPTPRARCASRTATS